MFTGVAGVSLTQTLCEMFATFLTEMGSDWKTRFQPIWTSGKLESESRSKLHSSGPSLQ